MRILAIETSCDETAVAVLSFATDRRGTTFKVLGNHIHSQTDLHAVYGGVYPMLSKREHKKILPLLTENMLNDLDLLTTDSTQTLSNEVKEICEREPDLLAAIETYFSKTQISTIDAIAVTYGPGLAPALWVGVNFARALALHWNIPLLPVNHMEGHIVSALAHSSGEYHVPRYPLLALLVSGGHTELVLSEEEGVYMKLGSTRDDAAGEAFDKAGRMLGLPYPGGPEIAKIASIARNDDLISPVSLPRPMIKDGSLDFSYAGLKTSLRIFLDNHGELSDADRAAIAREFENAIVDTLIAKVTHAVESYNPQTIVIGGGVSANTHLRYKIVSLFKHYPSIAVCLPELAYTTDNAVMIALAAYHHRNQPVDPRSLSANSNLSFPKIHTVQ